MGFVVTLLALSQWTLGKWSGEYTPNASIQLVTSPAALGVLKGAPAVVFASTGPAVATDGPVAPRVFFNVNGTRIASWCSFKDPAQIQVFEIPNGLRAYVLDRGSRLIAPSVVIQGMVSQVCPVIDGTGSDLGFRLAGSLAAGAYEEYRVQENVAPNNPEQKVVLRVLPNNMRLTQSVPSRWERTFPDVVALVDGGFRVGFATQDGASIDGVTPSLEFPDVGALRLVAGPDQSHSVALAVRADQSAIDLLHVDGGTTMLAARPGIAQEGFAQEPPFYASDGRTSVFAANFQSVNGIRSVLGTMSAMSRLQPFNERVIDLNTPDAGAFALLTEAGSQLLLRTFTLSGGVTQLTPPVAVNRVGAFLRSVSAVPIPEGFVVAWQEERTVGPQNRSYRVVATITGAGVSILSETLVPQYEMPRLARSANGVRIGRKELLPGPNGSWRIVVTDLDGRDRRVYFEGLGLPEAREFALTGSDGVEALVVRTDAGGTQLQLEDGVGGFASPVSPVGLEPLVAVRSSTEVFAGGWHADTGTVTLTRFLRENGGWRPNSQLSVPDASLTLPAIAVGSDGGMLVGATGNGFWMVAFDNNRFGSRIDVPSPLGVTHVGVASRNGDYLGVRAVGFPAQIVATQSSDGGSFIVRTLDQSELVTLLRTTATDRGDVLVITQVMTRDVSQSKLLFDVIPSAASTPSDGGHSADAGSNDDAGTTERDAGLPPIADGGRLEVDDRAVFVPAGCGCGAIDRGALIGCLLAIVRRWRRFRGGTADQRTVPT
jgi:hypothetical protein